jgi:hypothetical protein
VDVPLRQRVPYRTKSDRGADGIPGAGTTPAAARSQDWRGPGVSSQFDRGGL